MNKKIEQLALESFSLGRKNEFETYLSGFKAGYNAALKLSKDERSTGNQVEINGLKWDTENLEIDGQVYFTHEEALKAAASVGKRLPTKEEFESLLALGWRWSKTDKGIWIDKDKLFLPANGIRYYKSSTGDNQGSDGYYWASEIAGTRSSYLYFYSSNVCMGTRFHAYGLVVRCIQDVKKK